ncbi:DNA-binding transcription factor cat8 [Clarireedia jacksonii]
MRYFMVVANSVEDTFKRRVQESGKSLAGINTDDFLNSHNDLTAAPSANPAPQNIAPPRLFSDRCVNVFFQEWAPLFPVLHKPTFLRLYDEYVSEPEQVKDKYKLAQLHLVFGIAGLSISSPDKDQIAICENQWRVALDSILMENTLSTLQCLILALIYCIQKADYGPLQHYKGIAVGLSHRLGLHQSQRRFSFSALTIETRKRVFWTFYTVDCFSAALLGLPKLLKDGDVHAEYPSDTDDEYVTEKGYQPTLPGEYTKISSALALFRCSRILSKVLEQNYPAAATHDLSLQSLTSLETELNEWSDKLPTHLKLTFVQDKPSTDITGSRSALLSLAFYYIRSLIHRPAVGSTLGNKSSPSVISLADSSKHIIQIVQLLEERSMSFSFCLNKNEMLTLCGLSLLYQGLDLKQEGKLMQDSQRLTSIVIDFLEEAKAPGAADFKKLAASLIGLDSRNKLSPLRTAKTMPAPKKSTPSPSVARKKIQPQLYNHASASMSESEILAQQDKLRRATLPNLSLLTSQTHSLQGRLSGDAIRLENPTSTREHRSSVSHLPMIRKHGSTGSSKPPNLDYLSLNNTPASSQPSSPSLSRTHHPLHTKSSHLAYSNNNNSNTNNSNTNNSNTNNSNTNNNNNNNNKNTKSNNSAPTDWEILLGSLDGGQTNLYDAIYGGPALSLTEIKNTATSQSSFEEWSPDSWDMGAMNFHEFSAVPAPAQSVLSFSEESLSSGEELSASDLGSGGRCTILSGSLPTGAGYVLEGFEFAG